MKYSEKDFKLKISHERITPRGGLAIFDEFLKAFGFDKVLSEFLPAPRSGRGYPYAVYVKCLLYLLYGGGSAIADLRELRSDKALRLLLGLSVFPSDFAFGDWLRRAGSSGVIDILARINHWLVAKALRNLSKQKHTLIIDPTIIEANKADAYRTYLGCKGYRPVVAVFKETGLIVSYKFKEGNDNGGRVDILRAVFSKFSDVVEIGNVLLDSEYYTSEVINYLEAAEVTWAIGVRQDHAVQQEIVHIEDGSWSKLRDIDGVDTGCEVAETVHIMGKCQRAFRLIVKRWLPRNQTGLFANVYEYHVIATNAEEVSAQEVVWLYNQRSCVENNIKEVKGGFGLAHLPTGDFSANAIFFAIGVLAYNLFVGQKLLTLPLSWRHKTIASIRWLFVETAGKVVLHGGAVILKLSVDYEKFRIFVRARERLREVIFV